MLAAIEIKGLIKKYGNLEALKGIDMTLHEGEFFGLLGPNGAGKTTLINTIVGLARRSAGSISVYGMDVTKEYMKTKALIGLSPQEQNVDRFFKVRKILEFQGGFHGLTRRERSFRAVALAEKFGLKEKFNTQFWRLSGGMQKRVMVARSMIANPRILILDEPTAGVDVEQRYELWELLRNLNKDGTTIILTTHYIDEAEHLCERVGIIDRGEIAECGAPEELIHRHCKRFFSVEGERREQLGGFDVGQVQIQRGSLEQVFLKVTGHSIHEDETTRNNKRHGGETSPWTMKT